MRRHKEPRHLFRVEAHLLHEAFVMAGPNPTYFVRDCGSLEIREAKGLDLKRLLKEIGPPQRHPIPEPVAGNALRDVLERKQRLQVASAQRKAYRGF